MSTAEADTEATDKPKGVKPSQLVIGLGVGIAIFTALSGIAGAVLGWHDESEVAREVFVGIRLVEILLPTIRSGPARPQRVDVELDAVESDAAVGHRADESIAHRQAELFPTRIGIVLRRRVLIFLFPCLERRGNAAVIGGF